MDGKCECGCGGVTAIATHTDRSKGWERGKPLRFLLGHNARVTNRPRRTSVGPDDWTVEERGFETPCWIWKHGGPVNHRSRHRRVGIDGGYESVHAAVYRRLVGPVPHGCELHHRCEQQECVRPDHLLPLPKSEHLSIHKKKLSDDEVRAIRLDTRPLREIAAAYGTGYTYTCSIRTGYARRGVK